MFSSAFFIHYRDTYFIQESSILRLQFVPSSCFGCILKQNFENLLKMAPHTGSATPEQIEALLNFLEEHKDLARGRLRSIEGKVLAKRLWDELCNSLNSMGGCTKTVQQWQKVWSDRKHLAKKAAAESRRSASVTGGGPSTAPQLSIWELKVLAIMGDGFGERQTEARVPAFPEPYQTDEEGTPSTSSQPPAISQPSQNLPQEMNEPTQLWPASQTTAQESLTPQRSSHVRQPRRRHAASSSDIGSRLLRTEEQRREREKTRNNELAGIRAALLVGNNELTGIRAALVELCGLIKEYINK